MAGLGAAKKCCVGVLRVNVFSASDQRCLELGHEAGWGMGPHFSKRWEGVIPKGDRIKIDDRCARHGEMLAYCTNGGYHQSCTLLRVR